MTVRMRPLSAEEQRECGFCNTEQPESSFAWTADQYGIPWRKVCEGCWEAAQAEISGFVYDRDDAGESLEEET